MAKQERVTRARKRELEQPDEFLDLFQGILQFATKHQKTIIGVVGTIVLFSLVYGGFIIYQSSAIDDVSARMVEIMDKYETLKEEQEPDKAFSTIAPEFDAIMKTYSAGITRHAGLVYANLCFETNRFDKAVSLYQKAVSLFKNDKLFSNYIQNNLAYCYEAKKDYPKAISLFEKVADGPDEFLQGDACFHLGQLYAEQKNTKKSKEFFQKIIDNYKTSIYFSMVEQMYAG